MANSINRLAAKEAYELLNDALGIVMKVRMNFDKASPETVENLLNEAEEKMSVGMQWVDAIRHNH